ncbi:unnamed protein product [Triticum turgidum subsp. durum]|uniref:Uncharacterized protein n=1 Tax=Triticum turgidum subsp. durum TaxID=4567 RepID=A0A9R1NFR5_TRITD|nr:unnamed protein product [Triticum turgidum subsp. durum]
MESMAEKISTLILKVDLGCCPCYKKIRKILCKLQDEERIRTISYDDGNHTIAVAGPFDPHKLSCKIRCKGRKLIKGIHILQHNGGAEPPAMNNGKNNHKGKTKEPPPSSPIHEPPPPPPVDEKPPSPVQPAPPDRHVSPVMEATIEEKKPGENPAELKLPPLGHCGCSCCKPCYQGYYEGCRCCSCGRVYGYAVSVVPTPAGAGCYAGGGYSRSACQLFSDEDPTSACTIM